MSCQLDNQYSFLTYYLGTYAVALKHFTLLVASLESRLGSWDDITCDVAVHIVRHPRQDNPDKGELQARANAVRHRLSFKNWAASYFSLQCHTQLNSFIPNSQICA